jgi:hypothetical protein
MENKIKYGIVGLLSLLVAFGGYITLTQEELDNSYYCPSSEKFGIFYGGISSTGLTAYPYAENKSSYERCTNSRWILLKDYAKELGITSEQLMEIQNSEEPIQRVWGKQYVCGQYNCTEK